MKRLLCCDCAQEMNNEEIAMNLKLRGRAVGTFFCKACLSRRIDCPPETLTQMATFFRENGCELFSRQYVNE